MNTKSLLLSTVLTAVATLLPAQGQNTSVSSTPISVSGIYPSLASFNDEGECGTGAVVPWADRLWVITYGPHLPFGSSDKLYEITPDLKLTVRPESIGGTPANRMIHKESNQLFIGPYVIDSKRNVRVIPHTKAPGRYTGIARSTTDPASKVVIATMEEGVYEIDVNTLNIHTLFKDGNQLAREGAKSFESDLLEGVHGKGFYSSQGVYVFSNNGESSREALVNPRIKAGILAEYDGNEWKTIRRNQFTEVTGPGGIFGNKSEKDQLWCVGWDYKSVLLAVRSQGKWNIFRLPKASNSYDGAHGWNTEWPRIRNVGDEETPNYLMTMHGMFWSFPANFSAAQSAGIRPRSSYLKVVGDFTRWGDQLVLGCDDSAKSEFLNKRKAKGGIAGPGQSQSNLWFIDEQQTYHQGTTDVVGSVWQKEEIKAGSISDPYLFSGWNNRMAWIKNESNAAAAFTFEVDPSGKNDWRTLKKVTLLPNTSMNVSFQAKDKGEWIRVKCDHTIKGTVSFIYTDSKKRASDNDPIFKGIAKVKDQNLKGGLLYALGDNRRALGILANQVKDGKSAETGYYEMDEYMNIIPKKDSYVSEYIRSKVAVPSQVVTVDEGSYLIVDDAKRRWRLPLGDKSYAGLMQKQRLRICREVATERDLFNCGGTFYELPAENADGFAKIRPTATHQLQINDYASYRGLLVMTGIEPDVINKEHIFSSADGKCRVWAGTIDDLWKLGAPVGVGGPWINTVVTSGIASDPYLFGYYKNRSLLLNHQGIDPVDFTIEIDPTGDNDWVKYKTVTIQPGEKKQMQFPVSVQGRWIRFVSNKNVTATAWLEYTN